MLEEAYSHFLEGTYDQVIALCEAILQQEPTHLDVLNLLGITHILRKELSTAELHLQKALKRYPENPVLWFNLGQVYTEQSHLTKARECYQKGLALDPSSANAHKCFAG